MANLALSADDVLTTTRSVRRRLVHDRPVEPEVIDECLRIAVQAPTSVNQQDWHFVIVTDAEQRRAVADVYRRAWSDYNDGQSPVDPIPDESGERWFTRTMHEIPVFLVPCIEGRPEGKSPSDLAALYGSIIQAAWSFQLAARERGLGSVWTTYHLDYEREAAEVLGIPYDSITQVALIPVAYTQGTSFKPARRRPLDEVVHRDRW